MKRYQVCVICLSGRVLPPAYLDGYEAPVVQVDLDSLCLFTPLRWIRLRGALQ